MEENKEIKLKETKEYKNLPLRLRWAIDNVVEGGEELNLERESLNKKIDVLTNFKPIQELKDYIAQPKVWEEEKDGWYGVKRDTKGYTIYKPVKTPEDLKKWLEDNRPIYEENKIICTENSKLKALVFQFFDKIGLERKKYDYVGRKKSKEWVGCQWVAEVEQKFPTSCEYDWGQKERFVQEETKKIEEYWNKKSEEERQLKLKEEAEQKSKNLVIFLAELNAKHKLAIPAEKLEAWTVKDALLRKNKYLYLAHYLSKNRGDWNDGPSYAENGLDFFISQKTEEIKGVNDSAIYEDIQGHILNWGGDGRCFRDTTYNYDYLFGVVKENNLELYNDYCKMIELSPEE